MDGAAAGSVVDADGFTLPLQLPCLGGRLCLDFANTVDPCRGGPPREQLATYTDLLRWGRLTEVLGAQARRNPAAAWGRAGRARENHTKGWRLWR